MSLEKLANKYAPMLSNREVAKIFLEISEYLAMDDVPFKPRAYERAAEAVIAQEEAVADIWKHGGKKALRAIPGIGQAISEKIEELIKTGRLKYYETLKKKMPVDVTGLTAIEGVGPKAIKILWQKLGIRNLDDLEKAARAGRIRAIPRFGAKSQEKILKGIALLKTSSGRRILGNILPWLSTFEATIRKFPNVARAVIAGSVRRRKETVGDIDILVVSAKPSEVMKNFINLSEVAHVYGSGPTKTLVRLKNGLDADLRVVPEKSFGAALNYFTGSKEHNVALREIAIKRGMKLNEYGLFRGKKMRAGGTESGLYKALGLRYIEPELRENRGEIDAARRNKLPKLINYGDIVGDLQVQTNWTDGEHSISEMARAAAQIGLHYIAITDHTKSLRVANGLDARRIVRQWREIDEVNTDLKRRGIQFRVLKGTECDILKDGTLDLPDRILAKLDVVGISVHSHFGLSEPEQTRRIIRAMSNPYVDILFHPTGRLIGKREPIAVNIEDIIKTAKHAGIILEINSFPERTDLKDEYIKKAVEASVLLSVDSDAHNRKHFAFIEYGVAQARRGWAEKKDIVNAHALPRLLALLNKKR